jgi:hypothetical protein
MKSCVRIALLGLLAVGLGAERASATPVLWTLQGFTFNDGGTASGSFVYDNALTQFSSINITVTSGSLLGSTTFHYLGTTAFFSLPGYFFQDADPGIVGSTRIFGFGPDGNISPFLSGTGGVVSVGPGSDGICNAVDGNGVCLGWNSGRSLIFHSGSLIGTPLPEPSAWSLVPVGILVMLARRRWLLSAKNCF